jgi:hypothetical protein
MAVVVWADQESLNGVVGLLLRFVSRFANVFKMATFDDKNCGGWHALPVNKTVSFKGNWFEKVAEVHDGNLRPMGEKMHVIKDFNDFLFFLSLYLLKDSFVIMPHNNYHIAVLNRSHSSCPRRIVYQCQLSKRLPTR